MKIYNSSEKLAAFIYQLSQYKRTADAWCFVHVYAEKGLKDKTPSSEIVQFLGFYFNQVNTFALVLEDQDELLIVIPRTDVLLINKFEKEFSDNFKDTPMRMEIRPFDATGLEALNRLISRILPEGSSVERLLLTRLKRAGNCIMILDDDEMVTKQLEKLLSTSAYVVAMNKPDGFLDRYNEYAPDVLFLDIHLRTAKGNELLRELKTKIDPYAHVVMISSDTMQSMVMDIKSGGANGFIVKPFKRENVLQHLSRAPTFVPRHAKA